MPSSEMEDLPVRDALAAELSKAFQKFNVNLQAETVVDNWDNRREVADELAKVLGAIGADTELQGVVASWADMLDDVEVLMMLKDWNETGEAIHSDKISPRGSST